MTDERPASLDDERMFDTMAMGEHDEMTFDITRDLDPRVVGIESANGISFSAEAMTALFEKMEMFIGARMYRRMQRGEGPTTMRLSVKLDFDRTD